MQTKRAGRPRSERDQDIRKNFAIVEEPLERLRDEVARQDEHSRVDAAVRERIAEAENERLAETARSPVERVSPGQPTHLAAEWLDERTASSASARPPAR